MMKFRLRELLEREGAPTQSELARRIGMPRQQVNRLVNGGIKRIDLATLDRIYRALGCESVDELILHVPPGADPPDPGEPLAAEPSPPAKPPVPGGPEDPVSIPGTARSSPGTGLSFRAPPQPPQSKQAPMTTETLPPFTFSGRPLDMSGIGLLRSSIDAVGDRGELHRRIASDGYLFLPGYLDRDEVVAARMSALRRLADSGIFEEGTPLEEGRFKPGTRMRSAQDVPIDNPEIDRLLYSGRMIEFYELFLGGPVAHFDYTWFRAKTQGEAVATEPHCDIVFMSRGTSNLYTSWTPLDDIPFEMGGLMLLEGSHLQEELKATYGRADVNLYCENSGEAAEIIAAANAENRELTGEERNRIHWTTLGPYGKDPIDARADLGGRWLTADYRMGDLLVFTMYTMHAAHDNQTDRLRISTDSRYQLASEPIDSRWVGDPPPGNGIGHHRGTIC